MVAHCVSAVCASLGSPCARVRAGIFAGIPVIWVLEGVTQLRLLFDEAVTRLVVLRASLQNVVDW